MSDSMVEITLTNQTLLSGSSDKLRTAVGGFWYAVSSSDGESLEYEDFKAVAPLTDYFDKVSSKATGEYKETVDSDSLMLSKKFPIRIYGNSEHIKNDQFWKTIFLGGTLGGNTYSAIYSAQSFNYLHTSYTMPYWENEAIRLPSMAVEAVQITYDYNRYISKFQSYASSVESELYLPNYYLLSDMSTYDIYDEDADLFDNNLINLVTSENTYKDLDSLFTLNESAMVATLDTRSPKKLKMLTTSDSGYDYSYLNTTYLTASLPQVSLSGTTEDWASDRLQNILFDIDAVDKLYKTDNIESNSSYFPYYAKINFPLDDTSDFYESIKENDFSSKFIKTLYMAFDDRYNVLNPATASTIQSQNYFSGSTDGSSYSYREIKSAKNLRTLDYSKFLLYCHNTYSSSAENCLFVGAHNPQRKSAMAGGTGAYRHLNTVSSAGVISDMIAYLSSSANFDISTLSDVYGQNEVKSETLAYRISKWSGTYTGYSTQNFWIMNSDMQDFNFFDTQVKYGLPYTYEIWAYKLICGFKYKFSDLILTKQLACDLDEMYGLEFYDPWSDTREEQLFDKEGGRIQSLNDFATMAQVVSRYPYLADMYLTYEPFLQLVEVPVLTKEITITDNWPQKPLASGYQIIDNSQTIGFKISVGDHEDAPYLSTITSDDEIAKNNYLYSKDLLPTDNVTYESVSGERWVEVYRLSEKPTSTADFENNLIQTIDLMTSNSKYFYKTGFFENIIKTNQKYYYLFRILNEQSVPGHLSDIYEAELVNDGGYLYSVFNVLSESELEEKQIKTTSKSFKKLVQFQPRFHQTDFETSQLDYNQEASTQLENLTVGTAEDLIWDKTFKIRLTSKKTGKKIDLNITYKLQSEY